MEAGVANEDDGGDQFIERSYQTILAEQAFESNKILFLPTGSGKTFIAIMVLKRMFPLIEPPFSCGGKRVMFLVNTVALVEQQALVLERHLRVSKVGQYSGDMNLDLWNMELWKEEFEKFNIMVMTAEILNQLLLKKYISLANIALLILDECHHAVEDHPMRQIMKLFEDCPEEDQPRVIGLTATLLNGTPKSLPKVRDEVKKLEVTLHSTVATVDSWDIVKQFSTKPKETLALFHDNYNSPVSKMVNEKIMEVRKICKTFKFVLEEKPAFVKLLDGFVPLQSGKKNEIACLVLQISKQMDWLGIYGCYKTLQAVYVTLRLMQQKISDKNTQLMIHSLFCLLFSLSYSLEKSMGNAAENEKAYHFSSPKVQKLVKLIEDYYLNLQSQPEDEREPLQALIFVEEKMTAKILCSVLKNIAEKSKRYSFMKAGFIVGGSFNPMLETWEGAYNRHLNDTVIDRFRQNQLNVIVATDVLEEGIDIPGCNMVVRFDLAKGVRSYIQSKGRARHDRSLFYLMVSVSENHDYQNKIAYYCQIEEALEEFLVGHTAERSLPTKSELQDLYESDIEPYYTPVGSKVTLTSAIQLVNGYCMFLAHDRFSKVSPIWRKKDRGQIVVSVQLPRLSPLQEVVLGPPMASLRFAKRAAALEMCKRLHQIGELNDYLRPNEKCLEKEDMQLLLPLWEDEDQGQSASEAKTGTSKKIRNYQLHRPLCLQDCSPNPGAYVYIHHLEIYPAYEKPTDGRKAVIFTVLKEAKNFAIVSSKKLDEVCQFPIFSKFGPINVKISDQVEYIWLSEEQIMDVTLFHWNLFTAVIPMAKNFLVFSKDSYLIAPTTSAPPHLDWNALKMTNYNTELSSTCPDDLLKCVVTPIHRGLISTHEVYFVTRVCRELNAASPFPKTEYASYQDYFKRNHKFIVNQPLLPLLEVQPFKTVSNDLIPRLKTSESKPSDVVHFPFETCRVKFSNGCLFLKATMLPSILHRLERLLMANQLRKEITTNIGQLDTQSHDNECVLWWQTAASTIKEDICVSTSVKPIVSFVKVETSPLKKLKSSSSKPWSHLEEPLPVERDFENVSIRDIDNYGNFVRKKVSSDKFRRPIESNNDRWKLPLLREGEGAIKLLKNSLLGPHPCHIIEALTAASADDFWNLERLETLGDSFLKFVVSFVLFNKFPDLPEGKLTQIKGQILGNRNLFYCANAKNLGHYLKAYKMVPSEAWIPPSFAIPGAIFEENLSSMVRRLELSKEEQFDGHMKKSSLEELKQKLLSQQLTSETRSSGIDQQPISDKSVADCVESLIGAYLQTSGPKAAVRFLEYMRVVPSGSSEYLALIPPSNPLIPHGRHSDPFGGVQDLQDRLGYKFRNLNLLHEALTHSSTNSSSRTYERLEFVGDAVLDFLITAHIFEYCGKLSPGELTDLRSALVNNITFACLTVRYGFYKFLDHSSPLLMDSMDRFIRYQEKRNHIIDEEVLILLEEDECKIAETLDVPKALGDILEALIGAVFLDCGKSFPIVWRVIYRLMKNEICNFSHKVPKQTVRKLYETVGQHNINFRRSEAPKQLHLMNVHVVLTVKVGDDTRTFNGFGLNKSQAKKSAAKLALRHLKAGEAVKKGNFSTDYLKKM